MVKKEENIDESMFRNNTEDISNSINYFNKNEEIGVGIISTPAIDYKNYTNVSQINHKGIYQLSC